MVLRWTSIALVLAVTAGVTAVLTPLVRWAAVRRGLVVVPDEGHVHERPVPQLGGIAMFLGFLAGLGAAWVSGGFPAVFAARLTVLGILAGPAVIWAVGTVDDLVEVSAPAKTAGIVLGGSVLYWFGVSMDYFRIPFAGTIVLSADWKPLLVVLWVFAMTTAVNLIDGLDGLAAGIVAIASGSFLLYGHKLLTAGVIGFDNPSILVAAIALGLCIGFLPWNVHPARIFMGDGGALLLGSLMAVSTMLVGGRTTEPFSGQTYFFFAPLFIPLFILGVPIIDTVFAIVRRTRSRSGLANRDVDHLHNRLIRMGHGYWPSVLILWGWTLVLSAFVLYPAYTGKGNGWVPILLAALGLALYTWFRPSARKADPECDFADADNAT
ncbi:MAG: undecaprenyl/decaprenyl-phosphate alpha-N-acetylglucosaminyl 1-phosphate transferase [Actinobacteria bacterium]|nr:undecaprenyl/decaprenyl-phosphate alpha-N-acetylglucosaminyl 1-phosphate transferase [Actinomycetota bacterium]